MNTCDITFYPNKESNLEDWGLTLAAYKMGIVEKAVHSCSKENREKG